MKYSVLIFLTETEASNLLEWVHARHKRGAIIFCSQFEPTGWYGKFPEAAIADAIPDRIVHGSHTETKSAGERSLAGRNAHLISRHRDCPHGCHTAPSSGKVWSG